jgi:glutamine synthetase
MNKVLAEYIWIDGQRPTSKLRSKMRVLDGEVRSVRELPEWGFDGSSTSQSEGKKSDLLLEPVRFISNPLRPGTKDILVLCEVLDPDGTPHWSNTRAGLRGIAEKVASQGPWFGMEQEFTLFEGNRPLGWPDRGFPAPQGGYYCGVGSDEVFGRKLVEAHAEACLRAGLLLCGTNAEVMPAQWEFQIGPLPPLEMADELWLARWLLYRMGEEYGISATLHPKPVKGDWNGAGCHTNFSTRAMREPGGLKVIEAAMERLRARHEAHIQVYGAHNTERLTGLHETAPINVFRWGHSDRGCSIRIPMGTVKQGHGYFEDRRPAANCDPYEVCRILLETVCG